MTYLTDMPSPHSTPITPAAHWAAELSREQLLTELDKRIELIYSLRRQRDGLLETNVILTGIIQKKGWTP